MFAIIYHNVQNYVVGLLKKKKEKEITSLIINMRT